LEKKKEIHGLKFNTAGWDQTGDDKRRSLATRN